MAKLTLGALCAFGVVGCASHEGNFGAEPDKTPETPPAAQPAAPPKPVTFHYAPDRAEYKYSTLTSETPKGGTTTSSELDFTVAVTRVGKQFQNDTTVQAVLDNGSPAANAAEKIKSFHVTTQLDDHEVILSSASGGMLPGGSKDLGSTFKLPAKPVLPGDKWVDHVHGTAGNYDITTTFVGIEVVDRRRVATFEQQASGAEGAENLRPTVIKIDADSGILINRLAEVVFATADAGDVTTHFETKLK